MQSPLFEYIVVISKYNLCFIKSLDFFFRDFLMLHRCCMRVILNPIIIFYDIHGQDSEDLYSYSVSTRINGILLAFNNTYYIGIPP